MITLKMDDGSNGSIREWVAQHCESAVWQIEKGESTGYVHCQLTLTLNGKKADMAHALRDDIRVVCIDLARTSESYAPYEAIEQIKNGLIFSGKYDSRTKVFNPPHVFVFANFPPDQAKLSADRWHIVHIV